MSQFWEKWVTDGLTDEQTLVHRTPSLARGSKKQNAGSRVCFSGTAILVEVFWDIFEIKELYIHA